MVRARTIRRRLEGERWSAEEALGIKGTPWEPTPGVNPELIPTAVRRPPVAGEDMEVPPAAEPGLTARRTPLRKADFVSFGYTSGCPACVNLESEGKTRKGHNEVCRKRIEAESMKSEEGKRRVEEGYGRIANAAMRMHERDIRTQQAIAQDRANDQAEEGESLRKRHRKVRIPGSQAPDGSTEGLPPGTDEAGMRVDQSQEAPGAPHQPKPTEPESRGEKRRGDGDDEDREFTREDDLPVSDAASGSRDAPMDHLSRRDRQHDSGEKATLAALESEGRT